MALESKFDQARGIADGIRFRMAQDSSSFAFAGALLRDSRKIMECLDEYVKLKPKLQNLLTAYDAKNTLVIGKELSGAVHDLRTALEGNNTEELDRRIKGRSTDAGSRS